MARRSRSANPGSPDLQRSGKRTDVAHQPRAWLSPLGALGRLDDRATAAFVTDRHHNQVTRATPCPQTLTPCPQTSRRLEDRAAAAFVTDRHHNQVTRATPCPQTLTPCPQTSRRLDDRAAAAFETDRRHQSSPVRDYLPSNPHSVPSNLTPRPQTSLRALRPHSAPWMHARDGHSGQKMMQQGAKSSPETRGRRRENGGWSGQKPSLRSCLGSRCQFLATVTCRSR